MNRRSAAANDHGPFPDRLGRFGEYGGRYVPETLMPLVLELERAYQAAKADDLFQGELREYLQTYVGRPSPLFLARRLTDHFGGADIWLKREDLNHTGAHKINNCLGQILLARRMGKRRIIAETGAGQHGVATATVCALFGLPCIIYMGALDMERQAPNVLRMKLLGAEVRPVAAGAATLKDAMNEALRDWVSHVDETYYLIGSAAGPHPYPGMVRDFQAVIGLETRAGFLKREGRLPDALLACVGGGSNAIGLFHPFLGDKSVRLIGVEAAGEGMSGDRHAAALNGGRPGVLHGAFSYLLQNGDGQVTEAHSLSAGLDYPGVGPEHAWLRDVGRAQYLTATDDEAVAAFQVCARLEGIVPALECAHALARAPQIAAEIGRGGAVVLSLSGRGDKDLATVAAHLGRKV